MGKKIIKALAAVVLLLIIAAVALPFIYKDKINAIIKQQINNNIVATVDFKSFDLSIFKTFPDFLFELEDLTVVGKDEFTGDTLANIGSLFLKVDLMSVIKGEKYNIKAIELEDSKLHAIVLKDGKANWDIAKPSAPDSAAADTSETKFSLSLQKFSIKNTDVIYDDASMGVLATVLGLDHELKGDFTQDKFLMETMTSIRSLTVKYGGIAYLNKVKTSLKADLDMDMPQSKYTFKENELQLNDLVMGFDGSVAMPSEVINMDLKFDLKKADFKSIISLIPALYLKDFAGIKASGKLAFNGFMKGVMDSVNMPAFALKLLIENGAFQYPGLPAEVKAVNVDLKVNNPGGSTDRTIVDLAKFHAELGGDVVDAMMLVKTPVSDPDLKGTVKGSIDLGGIGKFMPLEKGTQLSGKAKADLQLAGKMSALDNKKYDEFNAAGLFELTDINYVAADVPTGGVKVPKMLLSFNPKNVTLSEFRANIGKSDLAMNGSLDNLLQYMFKNEVLKGTLNLNSSLIDLNELMGEGSASETTAPADTSRMSVVEVPSNIDFSMKANVAKLLYSNIVMDAVAGGVSVKEQTARLDGLSANLMDGNMKMSGLYNTSNKKKPKIDFDFAISSFDIPETVKTFATVKKVAAIAAYCRGKVSMKFKINGDLNQAMEPVLPTLQGQGSLSSQEIVIEKFEPFVKVASALKIDKYKELNLKNVNLSFKFENGRLMLQPFDVALGTTKLNIGGSSGFDQTIDYAMKFDIPRSELGSAANSMAEGLISQANAQGAKFSMGERINIDALIGGTVTNPTVKLGMKGMTGSQLVDDLKNKAKEEFDKKKAEFEAKAKAEADKLKAEAEKKKAELEAKAKAEADRLKAEAEKKKKELEDKAKAEADRLKKEAEQKAKEEGKKTFDNIFKKPK